MTEAAQPKKKSNSTLPGLLVLAVILVALCAGGVYVANMFGAGIGAPAGPAGSKLTDAYINSQVYVQSQLKAPSTAKFPYSGDTSAVTIKDLGSNTAQVTAYVDAQNSFGAMIRQHYTATLKWQHDDIWKVTDFKFTD